jgi:hypothetical protein
MVRTPVANPFIIIMPLLSIALLLVLSLSIIKYANGENCHCAFLEDTITFTSHVACDGEKERYPLPAAYCISEAAVAIGFISLTAWMLLKNFKENG